MNAISREVAEYIELRIHCFNATPAVATDALYLRSNCAVYCVADSH